MFKKLLGVWVFFEELKYDNDYIVNQQKMDEFEELFKGLIDLAEELNGVIEPILHTPKDERGDVTLRFQCVGMDNDKIKKFCDVVKGCDVIEFDTNFDGIGISFTVLDIFKHK